MWRLRCRIPSSRQGPKDLRSYTRRRMHQKHMNETLCYSRRGSPSKCLRIGISLRTSLNRQTLEKPTKAIVMVVATLVGHECWEVQCKWRASASIRGWRVCCRVGNYEWIRWVVASQIVDTQICA